MCQRFQKSKNGGGRKGSIEVLRQAHAHEPRQRNHDVDVAGEIGVQKERVDDGQPEGGRRA